MDNRNEIREFLGTRRAKLSPEDAGLPFIAGKRRVPGLRREEVAMLAGVSADYYVRLEKGNVTGVSDEVLDAVARALQLDEAERLHLSDLVHANRPTRSRAPKRRAAAVRPSIQWMLDAMVNVPAFAANLRLDILAINDIGRAFYAPVFDNPDNEANFARFCFFDERSHDFYVNWEAAADVTVAQLRMAAGRDPKNKDLSDLVGELSTQSEEFRVRWAKHEVRIHRAGTKQFNNPIIGVVEVSYNTIELPADPGVVMTAYTAEPGTPSADALAMLASWSATHADEIPTISRD